MFTVKAQFDDIKRQLSDVYKKHIPFATSLAINRTAQKVKIAQEKEIRDVFDRPTRFTENSVFIKPSNKNNLTAKVWLKDQAVKGTPAAKYLAAQITGGERRLKGYEVLLRSVGVLPDGYFTVPGAAAQMDGYGNIKRSQIVQIINYFRANRETFQNSNDKTRDKLRKGTKKKQGISYFVGSPGDGKLPLGIWQRGHSGALTGPVRPIRPIMIFVQSARYDAIYDFKFVADKVVADNINKEFIAALDFALRTAK